MFPQRELTALARHKVGLQGRASRHRAACVAAAGELTRPVAWLDRARASWRQLSPLLETAGLVAGLLAPRSRPASGGRLTRWLRRGTVVLSLWRSWRAMQRLSQEGDLTRPARTIVTD